MMKRCNNLNYNNMKKIFTLLAVAFATLGASAQTLPGLDDIIKTQPEGTLHKDLNHYFEGAYVNATDNLIYDHLGDGYLSDIVEAADGSLYIKNPFGFFTHGDIWVKAVKGEGNTYEVRMPQAVYDNKGDAQDPVLYAWRYIRQETGSETYAVKDAASQVVKFEMRNDSLVKVGETNAFIGLGAADGYFYGYGDTVSIYNKVKDAVAVPADASKAVKYNIYYNDSDDAAAEVPVKVVFEGDKVYIGGLDYECPELWISGTINGNKLQLTKWQYMGIDRKSEMYGAGHMYLYPFGWGKFTDAEGEKFGLYEVENPTLDYDAATKTFSTTELTLAVNRGHNYYPYVYYSKPTFRPASATSVDDIAVGEGSVVKYYDLSGRCIQRPAKGVFVKTTIAADGTKVAKKVIK